MFLESVATVVAATLLLLIFVFMPIWRRRARELRLLRKSDAFAHAMTRAVTRSHDTNEILRQMFEKASEIFGFEAGFVALTEEGELQVVEAFGLSTEVLEEFSLPLSDTKSAMTAAIRSREPIVVEDFERTSYIEGPLVKTFHMTSAVNIPLVDEDTIIGVLVLGFTRAKKHFNGDEIKMLRLMGDETALSMGRALLIQNLEQLDREKDEFISMVSHELRGPLATGRGFVELLQADSSNLGEKQIRYLEVISRNLTRTLLVIDDLQTVVRAQSGSLRMSFSEEKYSEVVSNFVAGLEPALVAQGVSLDVELEQDLPRTQIDRLRLEQVLTNLVSNAVKYSSEGETVALKVHCDGDGIKTSVIDHGLGIPSEDHALIFQKFFRARNAAKSKLPGSGLGLAICKAIVELHGGTIWFESEEGKGSTFSFWIPSRAPEA